MSSLFSFDKLTAKGVERSSIEAAHALHFSLYHASSEEREVSSKSGRCYNPKCPYADADSFDEGFRIAIINDSRWHPEYKQLFPEFFA